MSTNDEGMVCMRILSHENNKGSRMNDKECRNEMGRNKGKQECVHQTIWVSLATSRSQCGSQIGGWSSERSRWSGLSLEWWRVGHQKLDKRVRLQSETVIALFFMLIFRPFSQPFSSTFIHFFRFLLAIIVFHLAFMLSNRNSIHDSYKLLWLDDYTLYLILPSHSFIRWNEDQIDFFETSDGYY